MSTITTILEPSPDGTLHLPLPEHLRNGKVKVVATLEEAPASGGEHVTLLQALQELRKLRAFKEVADPVAWQREERAERALPDR